MQKRVFGFFMLLLINFSAISNPHIDSLKLAIRSAKHDTTRFSAFYNLAQAYYDSAYQKSIHYFDKALEISNKQNNWEQVADIHHHIATVYFNQGEFSKALLEYQNALSVYMVHNDTKGIGHVNNSIGVLYKTWGQYPKALEYLIKALTDFEKIGYRAGIGMASNNIGQIFFYQSDYQKAIDYFTIHYDVSKNIGNAFAMAGAANNMAASYVELNNHPLALKKYHEAAHIYASLNIQSGVAILNDNIGSLLAKSNDYETALSYHLEAKEVFESIGSRSRLSYTLKNVGYAYLKLKNYNKSNEYLLTAKNIAEELNQQEVLKEIYYHLSEVNELTGQPQSALSFYKLYSMVKDSLNSIDGKQKVEELELKYEADKQRSELTYLSGRVEQHRYFLLALSLLTFFFISLGVIIIRVNIKRKNLLQRLTSSAQSNLTDLNTMAHELTVKPMGRYIVLWPGSNKSLKSISLIETNQSKTSALVVLASKELPIHYAGYQVNRSLEQKLQKGLDVNSASFEFIINDSIKTLVNSSQVYDKEVSIGVISFNDNAFFITKNSVAVWVVSNGQAILYTDTTQALSNISMQSISKHFVLAANTCQNNRSFKSLVILIDKTIQLLIDKDEASQREILQGTIENFLNSVEEEIEVAFLASEGTNA